MNRWKWSDRIEQALFWVLLVGGLALIIAKVLTEL